MHHFKPKQICQLLLCGDMKYSEIPDIPYGTTTVRDRVGGILLNMVDIGDISQDKYNSIVGRVEPATDLFTEPTGRKGRRGRSEAEE